VYGVCLLLSKFWKIWGIKDMNLGEALKERYASIEKRGNKPPVTSIELPAEIESLITGSDYWRKAKVNRYKKLIREGHLDDLLELAKQALAKDTPANWFARVASKAQWQRTLDWLAKLREVAQNAVEVAKRLGVVPEQMKAVYKACWRFGDSVISKAVTAEETGRDKFKYFNWLCRYEGMPHGKRS
jgi:hypothetical protein